MGLAPVLFTLSLIFFLTPMSTAQSGIFKCNSPSTCRAIVDYTTINTTTISSIQKLFGVKNHRSILGANNLPLSTLPNYTIPGLSTIKIPFTCVCQNGTGTSIKYPIYTVQKDDGLYHIAQDVFSGLVEFHVIAAANNIMNVDLIDPGQKLFIPLPCSCDDVDGANVVHYGHLVEDGNKIDKIAQTYGTTDEKLMRLNNMTDPGELYAGHVLDVPLKPCESSVGNDTLDSPLLVANATYVFTANNCVKCKCDAAKSWTLQCEPSQVKPSKWITCPSMQCEGTNLYIGNMTYSNGCNQTCAYAGYTNQTILTTLVYDPTCAASGGNGSNSGNNAPKSESSKCLGCLPWNIVFIFVQLAAVYLHLFH